MAYDFVRDAALRDERLRGGGADPSYTGHPQQLDPRYTGHPQQLDPRRAAGPEFNQRSTTTPAAPALSAAMDVEERLMRVIRLAQDLRSRLELTVLSPDETKEPGAPTALAGQGRPPSPLTQTFQGYSVQLAQLERVLVDIHERLQV